MEIPRVKIEADLELLKKQMERARDRYSSRFPNDEHTGTWGLWDNADLQIDTKITDIEYDTEENVLGIFISSDLFDLDLTVKLTLEMLIQILETATKKYNKMKAALEAMK